MLTADKVPFPYLSNEIKILPTLQEQFLNYIRF